MACLLHKRIENAFHLLFSIKSHLTPIPPPSVINNDWSLMSLEGDYWGFCPLPHHTNCVIKTTSRHARTIHEIWLEECLWQDLYMWMGPWFMLQLTAGNPVNMRKSMEQELLSENIYSSRPICNMFLVMLHWFHTFSRISSPQLEHKSRLCSHIWTFIFAVLLITLFTFYQSASTNQGCRLFWADRFLQMVTCWSIVQTNLHATALKDSSVGASALQPR